MRLIVHAPNVHGGGGKVLLLAALKGVTTATQCTLIADARFDTAAVPSHVQVAAFRPSVSGRFAAERYLKRHASTGDVVICMGNLPPLFSSPARVTVFLQNRYLCEPVPLGAFSWYGRTRILVERLWLRRRLQPDITLLVQTLSMQAAVRRSLSRDAVVRPFADLPAATPASQASSGPPRFLYPASGEPHKNHATLLAAWRRLARSGIDAELHLTVERQSVVTQDIQRARADGVVIVNHGHLDPPALAQLYRNCSALVYPSRLESFGLPLLEAQALGLPIVAAERDYVRDLVTPAVTFDPDSEVSIARAVRRFLGVPDPPAATLTPSEFITALVTGIS